MMKGYEYTSPFAKKHIQLGRYEGVKEGVKLAARSLLTVMRVRGIDVPHDGHIAVSIGQRTDALTSTCAPASVSASSTERCVVQRS